MPSLYNIVNINTSFYWTYADEVFPVYYINDDKEFKILFRQEDDHPMGVLNPHDDNYALDFEMSIICTNGLDFSDIKPDNYNDYELIEIEFCDICLGSFHPEHPNYEGFCTC